MSAFDEGSLKETSAVEEPAVAMINLDDPVEVIYHPQSGIPAEFCEFSETFDKDLPWIMENCPEAVTPDVLAAALDRMSVKEGDTGGDAGDAEGGKKKEKQRGAGIVTKKAKSEPGECKVIINRIQRQKRKFVTSIAGIETIPDVRPKDICKFLGKKFASGAALSNLPGGGTELVIQGDVQYDLPEVLVSQYNVPATAIWLQEKDSIIAYHGA